MYFRCETVLYFFLFCIMSILFDDQIDNIKSFWWFMLDEEC